MGEINDAAIINALRRQMTLMAARQVTAAGNLANVNTPGYKAKEVTSFGDALDDQLAAGVDAFLCRRRCAAAGFGHRHREEPRRRSRC